MVLARIHVNGRSGLAASAFVVLLAYLATVLVLTLTPFNRTPAADWAWVGAVQSTSAAFRVGGPPGVSRTFVLTAAGNDPANILNSTYAQDVVLPSGDDEGGFPVVSLFSDDLTPNTKYAYYILASDASVLWEGSFTTPVVEGERMNFRVATAGCALSGSKDPVFDRIAELEPFMFLNAGDLHYADIDADDIPSRIRMISTVLGSESMRNLYTKVAMSYMWDDHDYCGNNLNAACEGRVSSRKAYQKAFPHYPLGAVEVGAAGEADDHGLFNASIYQAYTIGTVRFVLSELRSEAFESTDDFPGSIMSQEQRAWLEAEFSNAANYDFVVWLTSKPWVGPADIGGDNWQGFAKDREEISNFIADTIGAGSQNLLVVSSDAHMLAFDDGSNTDYSTGEQSIAGFPIIQSGPLHNIGSVKGGPFSDGCTTYTAEMNHQFSLLDFDFDGEEPCVSISSYRRELGAEKLTPIISQKLCGKIMKAGDAVENPVGSCVNRKFQAHTTALFVIDGLSILTFSLIAFKSFEARFAKHAVGILIGTVVLTFMAGVGLPLLIYLKSRGFQLESLVLSIVLLIEMIGAHVWLFVARKQDQTVAASAEMDKAL